MSNPGLYWSEKIAIAVFFLIGLSSVYWQHLTESLAGSLALILTLSVVAVLFRSFWSATYARGYRPNGTAWWIFMSLALISLMCIVGDTQLYYQDDSGRDYRGMVYQTVRLRGSGEPYAHQWAWPWQRLDRLPAIAFDPYFQGVVIFPDGKQRIIQFELILQYDPSFSSEKLAQKYTSTPQTINYICDELDELCQRDYQLVSWKSNPPLRYPLNVSYLDGLPSDLAEYKKLLERDVQAAGFLPGIRVKFAEVLPMAKPLSRP